MDTRLTYLLIGCLIGFVVGYLVRSVTEVKEKVEEIDQHIQGVDPLVEDTDPPEDIPKDGGFMRSRLFMSIALFIVVALTAWSAFSSQVASNNVEDSQHRQNENIKCVQLYLSTTISALNARTEFSNDQATANIELQRAFNKIVVASLQVPPVTEPEARKIVEDYAKALNHFLEISKKNTKTIKNNPYPTATDLNRCINPK